MENLGCDEKDPSIKFGKFLSNARSGEEVVITGISGKFPDSEDVYHFRDNLFNKVDMISDDTRRWHPIHPEIPQRTGKLLDIRKFDSGFFGIDIKQCNDVDPMLRMILESTAEAMFDAGYQPADFENTKTGVFAADVFHESEPYLAMYLRPGFNVMTGVIKSMTPHRISYFFKLKGPSYAADTACSSALYAMEHAYVAIRKGECDKAIVAGSNLCLHPYGSLQFARLGVLSPDGRCRSFDADGQGYARAETVSVMILEKAKDAKRIYAQVIHGKTNCDGFKQEGITYPSGNNQITLLKEIYTECGIDPTQLSYLEAHATGTVVGDPEECRAVSEVLLKDRNTPLLVGSVKSNIGHSEPASGMGSVAKVIIAFETGYIAPNLNFKSFRPNIAATTRGKLVVVTEKTAFKDDRGLVGISSFGFGGANCHILLKQNNKIKKQIAGNDNIPRLICVSGRTEASVKILLDDVLENKLDIEHMRLLQNIFRKNIPQHLYRGYSLVRNQVEVKRSITVKSYTMRPIYITFGTVNTSLLNLGKEIKNIPEFAKSLMRSQDALLDKDINIDSYLENPNLNPILIGLVIQIGLSDIIKQLEIKPNMVFGQSAGELAKAYFNGSLTLKDTLNCAYLAIQSLNGNGIPKNNKDINIKHIVKVISQHNLLIRNKTYEEKLLNRLVQVFKECESNKSTHMKLHKKGVIIEIGEPISTLRKNNLQIISMNTTHNPLNTFFESVGRIYELGHDVQLHKIYPKVEFPVSRSTPMISPKIKWSHKNDFFVVDYRIVDQDSTKEQVKFHISVAEDFWSYLDGHVIDGRNIFPGVGYLYLVWDALAYSKGMMPLDMSVRFENIKFKRATTLPKRDEHHTLNLTAAIHRGTNKFEVLNGDVILVTGTIKFVEDYVLAPLGPRGFTFAEGLKELTLNNNDIYKELRLRGYQFRGFFKSLNNCSESDNVANIIWQNNFVAFMDTMLQLRLFQKDTRLFYLPISLKSVYINAPAHLNYINELKKIQNPNQEPSIKTLVPCHIYPDINLIRSGFIEITGIKANPVNRKKMVGKPVLETYQFVPNQAELPLSKAIRVALQIILENSWSIKNKIVELIDDATTAEEPLSALIRNAFDDQPLVQSELKILSKREFDIDIEVEDKILELETDCTLVIGTNLIGRPAILQKAFNAVKQGGYVLSRQPLTMNLNSVNPDEFTVFTEYSTGEEKLILLKKRSVPTTNPACINISSKNKHLNWMESLKEVVKNSRNVIIYSQNEPLCGIIGLVNCIRREPGGDNVMCMFITDEAPTFEVNNKFYSEQLKKNMAINVYKDGVWGTYRHLPLENKVTEVETEHCFVNNIIKGDLSTLTWFEGSLTHKTKVDSAAALVSIYYSALNFRDIMTASGRISVDVNTQDRKEQEYILGMEFAGRDQSTGKRVMGMVNHGAIATLIETDPYLLWEVPDTWSLEEAATVPVVYGTCIYALHIIAKVKASDSILIHSASGGVGQAALNLCLHLGCKVFVTVGTQEKRDFIKKQFPELRVNHIGNSRDLSFEQMIKKQTHGRGVDIVLNSLAEDKFWASVRCLAEGGRFLEIGKFDLANDNMLDLSLLNKDIHFHGIMFDKLCSEIVSIKKLVADKVTHGVKTGVIKPLVRTVFAIDEVEKAFRYMGTGKHMGKVLIKIREEEAKKLLRPTIQKFKGLPRYFCNEDKSYIICGGLGGFGLELADWLVLRGAKNLVLSSRKGITTGYQNHRIRLWKSYGCIVKICTKNITTKLGCEDLIKEANDLGQVEGIFNLAVILEDAIFENQTEESFQTSFGPKAYATEYLDEISRRLCPELKDFVIFSSVSCGRGNAGQTNYGMANSIMERICEKRRLEGLPALAIQWGTIADVGLVAQMQQENFEIEIGGTLQQSVENCLQTLDIFMRQQTNIIVSSMVVAEKRTGSSDNLVEVVAKILGIRDLKSISMYSTLAELGMDSMTAVEIKQTLEREYDIMFNADDIKFMTFARIQEIQDSKETCQTEETKEPSTKEISSGFDLLIRFLGNEANASITIHQLPSKDNLIKDISVNRPKVLMFPGIEGTITALKPLAMHLDAEVFCIQYCIHEQKDTINEMADTMLRYAQNVFLKSERFNLVCHSYGFLVAMELVKKLEDLGYQGTITSIDASPDYLKQFLKIMNVETDENMNNGLMMQILRLMLPTNVIDKHAKAIFESPTMEKKREIFKQIVTVETDHSAEYQIDSFLAGIKRIKSTRDYKPSIERKINSSLTLIKPAIASFVTKEEDYGLSKFFSKVNVHTFEGNHVTILENEEVGNVIGLSIKQ